MSDSNSTAVTRRSSSDVRRVQTLHYYKDNINSELSDLFAESSTRIHRIGNLCAECLEDHFIGEDRIVDWGKADPWFAKNIRSPFSGEPVTRETIMSWVGYAGWKLKKKGKIGGGSVSMLLEFDHGRYGASSIPSVSYEDYRQERSPGRRKNKTSRIEVDLSQQGIGLDLKNIERIREDAEQKRRSVKVERELAVKMVDIGYVALSKQFHPDKGGSDDAMARLNKIRQRLKAHIEEWR